MTNGDVIRRMTDEDLAEFMTHVAKESAEMLCETIKRKLSWNINLRECDFESLAEAHLKWLVQEVQE